MYTAPGAPQKGLIMSSIKRALDLFANGYEEITGDMLHKDLKFLRNNLESAGWRFCPDVYGNGVYVFAG